MARTPYRKILVRATNWVGDAVMCLPALEALRKQFPASHISILARPWVADLYRGESFCDELILYDAPRGWKAAGSLWAMASRLRKRQFDCAVLLQNAFEAALVSWLARIPVRIGYDRDGRGLLLTHRVAVPKPGEIAKHQRFYYLELLNRSGLLDGYAADAPVRFRSAREAATRGRELFRKRGVDGRVIGVSPGAAFGSAKRWLPERFAQAAVSVAREREASVAVFGTRDEATLGAEVAAGIAGEGVKVLNYAGETPLRGFVDMAAACELFLTNDSGSMHIASAMGVPVVVIFGPTDEAATGPAGQLNVILRHPVECAPCHLRECPIDHRCMTGVTVDAVAAAGTNLLQRVC